MGKRINPAVFNDYNVGRVLDKAYAIGAIRIFSAISKRAVDVFKDQWQDLGILSSTKPTVKRPAAHYKGYESGVELHGKKYRAVVIYSSAHDKRRQKRIDRELKADRKVLEDQCKTMYKKDFFCLADVQAAQQELSKTKCK